MLDRSWADAIVGEGSQIFQIEAQDNTGKHINFDYIWVVDMTGPTVIGSTLGTWQNTLDFIVSWSRSDNLTSIYHYDVQIMEGLGSWMDWQPNTTQTSANFTSQDGKTSTFRVRAGDATGNLRGWSTQVATTVDATALMTNLNALPSLTYGDFIVAWSGSDVTSGLASYTIEVRVDEGSWTTWISGTTATSSLFTTNC